MRARKAAPKQRAHIRAQDEAEIHDFKQFLADRDRMEAGEFYHKYQRYLYLTDAQRDAVIKTTRAKEIPPPDSERICITCEKTFDVCQCGVAAQERLRKLIAERDKGKP